MVLVVAIAVGFRCLGPLSPLLAALLCERLLIFFGVLVLVIVVRVGIGLGESVRRQAENDSQQCDEDASRFHGPTGDKVCFGE